ncbi:MAG TPA: hypothetical protein VLX28_28005 [Thermoanaerobaculia bacterium]|nr:hypothetical protein [Thermoanaerobaculia bacterium]
MHAHKLQVTVPEDHDLEISVHLPDDFPSGPAEVIVLAAPQGASRNAGRSPQSTAAALKELLSFQRTPEEEKILDDFESFQREHPFSLSSLAEKP